MELFCFINYDAEITLKTTKRQHQFATEYLSDNLRITELGPQIIYVYAYSDQIMFYYRANRNR